MSYLVSLPLIIYVARLGHVCLLAPLSLKETLDADLHQPSAQSALLALASSPEGKAHFVMCKEIKSIYAVREWIEVYRRSLDKDQMLTDAGVRGWGFSGNGSARLGKSWATQWFHIRPTRTPMGQSDADTASRSEGEPRPNFPQNVCPQVAKRQENITDVCVCDTPSTNPNVRQDLFQKYDAACTGIEEIMPNALSSALVITCAQALLRPLKPGETRKDLAARCQVIADQTVCGIKRTLPCNLKVLLSAATDSSSVASK